jgi:hypothetical protein
MSTCIESMSDFQPKMPIGDEELCFEKLGVSSHCASQFFPNSCDDIASSLLDPGFRGWKVGPSDVPSSRSVVIE